MLKWIHRLFKLLPMHLPSNHHQDIAGSDEPTLDNLREEAIAFDKNIKDYIARASGQQPKLALGNLFGMFSRITPSIQNRLLFGIVSFETR